jgi:hypothetical protein
MRKTLIASAALLALLVNAAPAGASTTVPYQSVFVEPYGGPNQSPFDCGGAASCGSGTISGLGHIAYQEIQFNDCGLGCHSRNLVFRDGSSLWIREVQPGPFVAVGNAGTHGYIGFGLPGNPQSVDIAVTITGGTGRFEGASGGGTATVKVAGGIATIKGSGTITLP